MGSFVVYNQVLQFHFLSDPGYTQEISDTAVGPIISSNSISQSVKFRGKLKVSLGEEKKILILFRVEEVIPTLCTLDVHPTWCNQLSINQ